MKKRMRFTNFNKKEVFLLGLTLFLSILLRLVWIDTFPPAPYSDEVNQAYNAYSILKTGKDEHGNFLPVSLRSFGDWKPPLQTYLMIPSIALLGLNVLSLRLPNAVLGVLSVLLSFFLVKELFSNNSKKESLALLVAFLISISPWHLHQSRSAMLVMVSLFFTQLGLYFFLKFPKRKYYLFLSVVAFVLSFYSYYGMRLIIPLLGLYLFIRYQKQLLNNKKFLIVNFTLGLFLILPLFIAYLREPNVVFGRVKNVSIFYDKGTKLKLGELLAQDLVVNIPYKLSPFYHNKPYLYAKDILKRFFEHLDGQFLFIRGDLASPFLIPNMGVFYIVDGLLIVFGALLLLKNKEHNTDLLFIWLIVSILPASLTFLTPTQNRTFNSLFPFSIFIAYGLLYLLLMMKTRTRKLLPPFILAIVVIYSFSLKFYLNNFYKILPLSFSREWLFGFKEVVEYINQHGNYSKVIFLPKTGMAYIYVLFYNQYPPQRYINEAQHEYSLDRFGFEHVKGFNKYTFLRKERSWEEIYHLIEKGELYIGREEEIPADFAKEEIYYPDGKVAFRITYL